MPKAIKIAGVRVMPKWEWSAWYRASVSPMMAKPAEDCTQKGQREHFERRRWQYAEWLAERYGWPQSEALELVQSLGECGPVLTAEECRIDEPQLVPIADTLACPPKPARIGGISYQPKWHWSPLYRSHVAAQWSALSREPRRRLPMKKAA